MATQNITTINRTGENLSTLAVAADVGLSDKWTGTGKELLYINNGGGSPITLTLNFGPGATIDGQTPPNHTISVPAGQALLIGPFPTNLYNDANGFMNIAYSAVTSVKILVILPGN